MPRQLYEAIAIEGANRWQRFRYVTLPMLTPVIFFTLIIGVIDGFQYFDQAFVAGNTASGQSSTLGNPQGSLLFYSLWIYQQAFVDFHMGYAVRDGVGAVRRHHGADGGAAAHLAALGALRREASHDRDRRQAPRGSPATAPGRHPPPAAAAPDRRTTRS